VDRRRTQAIGTMIGHLHDLLTNYRSGNYKCGKNSELSFVCGSVMSGALTKELDSWGLLSPYPKEPFSGLVLSEVQARAQNTRSCSWMANNSSSIHACNLATRVAKIVNRIASGVEGPSLEQMQDAHKKPTGQLEGTWPFDNASSDETTLLARCWE
jgi:hypothetical protein